MELDLDALERIAQAATPGPWEAEVHQVRRRSHKTNRLLAHRAEDGTWGCVDAPSAQMPLIPDDGVYGVMDGRDAMHIAAFDPPTALALIARVRELEAVVNDGGNQAANVKRAQAEALRAAAADYDRENGRRVHACPVNGAGVTGCCGRTLYELPVTDRVTQNRHQVTCTEREIRTPDTKEEP